MVWASPVCAEYSRALTTRPRRLLEGDALVLSALEIIAHFDPLMWVIEPFMERPVWVDVTYCKYGTPQEADAAVDQHALEAEAEPVQARQPLRGVAGRQAPPGRAAGAAADGGAVREGQPITRAALQRSCRAVRGDCARGHGGACGAAEHSGLILQSSSNPTSLETVLFSMFLHVFWAVPLNAKNGEEGHPAFVFWAHSKAVSRNFKNEEEGHRASFLVFWAHSKAVSQNAKNGEDRHRALVKHGNARAGERHQLVGHQMNEQVRHRAVQALEGEPGKVARAGADTTQRHLGHALGGKAGNEAVAQVAHAADVDVAHRVVVSTREDREEVEVLRGSLHGVVWVLQAAQLHLRLQEAVLLPHRADGGHVLPPSGSWSPRRCPKRSQTRP